MQLTEDAAGDPRNAQFLCRACQLAYLPEAEGVKGFRDDLGLAAKLISVDNTQVYIAESPDHIVVAFRGTENPTSIDGLKDWLLTDAMNLLVVPEGRLGHDLSAAGVGAKFHKGFVDAIAEIWEPLREDVEGRMKKSDRPLWITGHSLGGALALLAAWLLKRRFIAIHQIYTYGAPMIGNQKASDAFNKEFKGQIFRYVSGIGIIEIDVRIVLNGNVVTETRTVKEISWCLLNSVGARGMEIFRFLSVQRDEVHESDLQQPTTRGAVRVDPGPLDPPQRGLEPIGVEY